MEKTPNQWLAFRKACVQRLCRYFSSLLPHTPVVHSPPQDMEPTLLHCNYYGDPTRCRPGFSSVKGWCPSLRRRQGQMAPEGPHAISGHQKKKFSYLLAGHRRALEADSNPLSPIQGSVLTHLFFFGDSRPCRPVFSALRGQCPSHRRRWSHIEGNIPSVKVDPSYGQRTHSQTLLFSCRASPDDGLQVILAIITLTGLLYNCFRTRRIIRTMH